MRPSRRHFAVLLLPLLVGVGAAGPLGAGTSTAPRALVHEVPADVTVQLYVRPAGDSLTLLVRVPLASMRDMEFPMTGPGYLVLEEMEGPLRDAVRLWIADYLAVFEDGRPLPQESIQAVRLSVPSDRSFTSFAQAEAHILGAPLPPSTRLPAGQALVDARLTLPIGRETARFSLEPELAHLGVSTLSVIHYLHPDGRERVFQYRGNPGMVRLDPRWFQAAATFVWSGFLHILEGIDHLLFLLCLIIPFRRVRPLIPVVTAFTVAHSITLVAAALGLTPEALWFPPLVETLIALSIVWMALENMVGARLDRRWQLAFAFGLVHGFGFSFVLQESLQFAGSHLVTSLLAFNVGVELGQVAVLVVAVPVVGLLVRRLNERAITLILSAVVAHEAWHWMTERGGTFLAYEVNLPAADVALLATGVRWLVVALIAAGAAWGLSRGFRWLGWGGGEPARERAPSEA